ncbi:MAG: nucleotidyltransferase domain-containing protein [Roseburia sp.]|nr:nucleotidyltransferase domain-containing protein [Roseburia sp.]
MLLTIDKIERGVKKVSRDYPIKKVSLFGSYANGTFDENSDVDLLVEFDVPHVSLFLLSGLRLRLQDELGKDVDLVHAPISKDSIIEIGEEISLYES